MRVSSSNLRVLTLIQVALLHVHAAKVRWLDGLATADLLLAGHVVQAIKGCRRHCLEPLLGNSVLWSRL